jgi:carboxyl-terminal processing protease
MHIFRLLTVCLLSLASAAAPAVAGDVPLAFPNMAPTVGELLDSNYYRRATFNPKLMVERALRSLCDSEPSVLATWRDGQVVLQIGGPPVRLVKAPVPTDLKEAMEILEAVRLEVDGSRAFSDSRARELDYALLNGALLTLDPHTILMRPEFAQEFAEDIKGKFFGIGAILREDEGLVQIERVLPGLPAERAGVEDGDVILAIDGEKTAGLSLGQAVRRIKGEQGTIVRLLIDRKATKQRLELAIKRDMVTPITERATRLGDIGYVRMDEFHEFTYRRLYEKVNELQQGPGGVKAPLKAFILDLRYNGGGLLDQARLVSDFFLPGNLEIVRTVYATGAPTKLMSTAPELLTVPMVILVSPGTASAAEIVSGCLQLHDRAVIIGDPTFGKGSVQTTKMLRDRSLLKVTIQEYQLPGGASIQRTGVIPDVRLIGRNQGKDGRIDLLPFSNRREADDEFALSGHDTYHIKTTAALAWMQRFEDRDSQRAHDISAREFKVNQQAQLVVDLLHEATADPAFAAQAAEAHTAGKLRTFLLGRLKEPLAKRSEIESARIAEALAKLPQPIVWGDRSSPAPGDLDLRYDGPSQLVPGETAELRFTVANRSAAPATRLWALIESDLRDPLWEEEVVIGAIPAGSATSATLRFPVPPRLHGGSAAAPAESRFTAVLRSDGSDTVLARLPVSLHIADRPRPHLSYAWRIEDRTKTPITALRKDEPVSLVLTAINDGDGPTGGPVEVAVFKDNDPFIRLEDSRLRTDRPLKPGEAIEIGAIPLTLRSSIRRAADRDEPFTGESITLQVRMSERIDDETVRDARGRAELFHSLTVPLESRAAQHLVIQPLLATTAIRRLDGGRAEITTRITANALPAPRDARGDDGQGSDGLAFVSLFIDRDKVDLKTAEDLVGKGDPADEKPRSYAIDGAGIPAAQVRTLTYRTAVTLKPGLNEVRILASTGVKVIETLDLRLWGDEVAAGPATAATPAPPSAAVVP